MVFLALALSFSEAIVRQPSRLSKRDLPPDYFGSDEGNGYENDLGGGGEKESGMNIVYHLDLT